MPNKKMDWNCLKRLYEFESSRVSGPATCRRDINDVLWSINELQSSLSLSSEELKNYTNIIDILLKKGQIMKIPMETDSRYITRVAEIVRLLGHNYEYWYRGRQSIDSVRWLVEDKKIPSREIGAEDFMEKLLEMVRYEIGNDNSTFNLRKAIEMVVKGIAKSLEPDSWKKAHFSEFQLQATKEMILSQFKAEHEFKAQILIAGVGSGKTIGFSIGMLVSAVEGILSGERNRRCHLFLYPRKALAKDQYNKLKDITKNIGLQELRVHFEHYSYYSSENLSVKRGIPKIYGSPNPPPSLIVTTLETLNRRLQHPLVIKKISRYLKRVVLDEIHLVEGIPGCHIVRLMDRLRQSCSSTELLWTGSSATVASPDLHAATVFGINRTTIKIIEPNIRNLKTVGLVHHIFMRPNGRLSFLGSLVNSTSIMIHNRRNKIWNRKKRGNYQKGIGFADSLDLLGRWNSDFRENERTEKTKSRPHPTKEKIDDWKSQQREVPYALRFHKPLEKRISVDGGEKEPYENVLSEFKDQKICDRCKKGERFVLKTCDKEEMRRLGRLVYRWPHKKKDNVKVFNIDNEIFKQDSVEVGTLDLCPFLRAGACFWFPNDDLESEEIVGGAYPRWEWRSVARSKIHSSKTQSEFDLDVDLSDLVFTAPLGEVYDLKSEETIPIDLVLASPSLEVGVDLPNVTESIMFKAIRNVASYRQKVGRIGREEGTNTVNVSLLSLRPVDLHYYRQPRKLISRAQLEPIPLKEYNDSILRCALYLAVWDYLAAYCNLPEVVPIESVPKGETEFSKRLRFSREYLNRNSKAVAEYLSGISRGEHAPDEPIIQEAIRQVSDELGILLTPISGTIDDTRLLYVSDMIVHSLSRYGVRVKPPSKSRNLNLLRSGKELYEHYRPSVNPILFELGEQFRDLDRLNDCGWADLELVKKIYDAIGVKIETIDINSNPFAEESKDNLEFIHKRALGDILKGLQGMRQSGENPIVIYFYEQFDKFSKEHRFWAYYLSYMIQGMPIFRLYRRNPSYVRPPNLFTNPYEDTVTLYRKGQVVDSVPISEAMFGFIPGTWTFRLGKNAKKTLVGKLDSYQGGVLSASLDEMKKQGSYFIRIKTDVPAPPGFPGDQLTIYMPTKLGIETIYGKYVRLNPALRTIIDNDECSGKVGEESIEDDELGESANRHVPRVKIPKCYANQWVHIVSDEGRRILVNELDEEYLVVEGKTKTTGREARRKIFHPLLKGIIDSVLWHDKLRVYDYVYAVSRSYSSKDVNNATLMFRDQEGDIAFGRSFLTEGVSFNLNPETIKCSIETIKKEMLGYEGRWVPSILKALLASVSSIRLADGTPVSPFLVSDLFGILITSISSNLDVKTIVELPKIIESLLEDEARFREAATKFYKGKYSMGIDEEESFVRDFSKQNIQDINRQVKAIIEFASQLRGNIPDLQDKLEDWIINTLLNTFAVVALSALQRLCGSKEENIGCTVDLQGIKDRTYKVFLYDRTPHGNGSSDVMRRYLHILNIQRHKQTDQSRLLPSEDYLTLLEQELLQCPQFHTDMDALEKFKQQQKGEKASGLSELGYVSEYSDEVLRVGKDVWEQLGIRGRQDAWKLPVISLAPGGFASSNKLEIDDILRATTICWNGCPECVIHSGVSGVGSQAFVDKAVLDEWFKIGRSLVEEYSSMSVQDLATGKTPVKIGKQSRVCLERPQRKIRSISLPYTIGFELERDKVHPHAKLIVRDDDIQNLRVFKEEQEGSSHGIESLGFKRIMWYNLMTCAYLDILELFEETRKEITLVFYDCRDVTFDDVGISPRMMEAIEHHRKKSGMEGDLRSLSDILIWLANRGFRISLCVDEKRSQEEGVHDFLMKLASKGLNNITIKTKLLHGLMHKKALVTPMGIIQGSANLTYSGTGPNEEIINYFPHTALGYHQTKVNITDTFHGSHEWR